MSKPPGRRVLVAGGGVAALEAVLSLQELAQDQLEIALLAPNPRFEYAPLSVAEPFDLGRAHRFELREILRNRGVGTIIDALEEVDADERVVRTAGGLTIPYSALLVAIGARRRSALPGAITFSGSRATSDIRRLLRDAATGTVERVAFAVPAGVTWSLPAYELALMTSAHLAERELPVEVALVTPEPRPVDAFGPRPSAAVEEVLGLRGIAFHSAVPVRAEPDRLVLADGEPIAADAVVALPKLVAPEIPGLPVDELGFLPVDEHGRVRGVAGVYAAGDVTSFPLKQGGIATQQADAAAEAIAADLGEDIRPAPFRPVLRGLLLTGRAPRYLRAEVLGGRATRSTAEEEAIWWPPAKIAGRRLGPFLALQGVPGGAPPDAVALELDACEDPDEDEPGG
ncbi:MAG: NAD(P)/FAD-dependent oxidoreductase [Solirubrobacterales bacterium]